MDRKEIIEKLENFIKLLNLWTITGNNSEERSRIRSSINKEKTFVQNTVIRAGTIKFCTIAPPPAVGGLIMRDVNPFDIIFERPYGINVLSILKDSIDEAIGIIEADENFSLEHNKKDSKCLIKNTKKVFLVHGHDNELKEKVARFLERIDLLPIILHEQANRGMTIIEKFEEHSDVLFAIILMTPDDLGNSVLKKDNLNYRARQNVILELLVSDKNLAFKKVSCKNTIARCCCLAKDV